MQLRDARLCLDCEEVHDESRCPVCASEAFTYVARWVPSTERRPTRKAPPPHTPLPAIQAPARRVSRLVTGGALGLAVLATARWLLSAPAGATVSHADRGERREDGGQ